MSTTISMLDQGHEFANNAADYYARGLLIPASAEHYKAAEAFQTCVNQSTDEHTKSTLRKLCTHHKAVGKDLQRRITKLREEGKDPALPQTSQTSRPNLKGNSNEGSSGSGSALQVPQRGKNNLESSASTFDESFMVLNQQSENNGDDSPFDLFWKVTGEIMVNLSQPMSFQTAAMAALEAVESRTASTNSETGNQSVNGVKSGSKISKSGSQQYPPKAAEPVRHSKLPKEDDFEFDDEDYDSLDDFCLVPSSSSSDLSSSARLKKENEELKTKLVAMETQMGAVRRQITLRNEQDQQLRDNIMLARKEAQRAMVASTSFAAPSMHSMAIIAGVGVGMSVNGPQSGGIGGRDRETALLRRIRELEDEMRVVRSENDKQKAMITKFRERWERLKESAKRKKSAKASSAGQADSSLATGTGVRERIDEDPEGEAAAEDSEKSGN